MNKIISANINGFVFQIDETAYESLKAYLETIRQKVHSEEIVADIENRIAELFDYKLQNGRQAIFADDVQDIISQIGSADQFGSDEQTETKEQQSAEPQGEPRRKGYRRLYRNDDDKVVGGVCSGIAAYFDIDPIIPRIAFAAAFFFLGTGLMLYLFLMIVVPKALTPAQKLEMRGEAVDYKNLSKTVEKDFKDAYERYKPQVKTGFERVLDIALRVGMILLIIFLVSIFIPGCVAVFTSIGVASWSLPVLNSYMFTSQTESIIILIGLVLFLVIPVIGIGYKLIRIIFKTRPMSRILTVTLSVLWVVGFAMLSYSTFHIGTQFSSSYKVVTEDTMMADDSSRTLILKVNESYKHTRFTTRTEDGEEHINITTRQDMKEFLDEKISEHIHLEVVPGLTRKPVIKITKRSAGATRKEAAENAGKIDYSYSIKDSTIFLNDFFSLGAQQLWRNQKVTITVEVPVGYRLYIDRSCNRILDYSGIYSGVIHNSYDDNDDDNITNKYLNVEEKGIVLPEK